VRTGPLDDAQVPEQAHDLIIRLLNKDPSKRMKAQSALEHPYLQLGVELRFGLRSRSALLSHGGDPKTPETPLDMQKFASIRSFRSHSSFMKTILTLVAHQSCMREVEDLRAAFMMLETSGTGSLSKDTIKAGIQESGFEITDKDIDDIFQSLDAHGSGEVKYTEWLAATMRPSIVASQRAVKQLYTFFDIDRNGKVSREELFQVLGDEGVVSDVMKRGDTTGDGELDEYEFEVLMREIANTMDQCVQDMMNPLA